MTVTHRSTSVRRPWLERVLDTVRELGASDNEEVALRRIADACVEVLEFGAASINVCAPEDMVRAAAVSGPSEAQDALVGTTSSRQSWITIFAACEQWGSLLFYGHDRDQSLLEGLGFWRSSDPFDDDDDDAWHPDDLLFAPLHTRGGDLLGFISVDQPRSGRRPDLEQLTALELFAAQAASALAEGMARREAEAHRREIERRWQLAFEHSPVGSAMVNPDGSLDLFNPALVAMLGYRPEQLARMNIHDLTHPDDIDECMHLFGEVVAGLRDSFEMEKRYRHADGHSVWGALSVGVIRDEHGAATSIVGQVNDVSGRKRAEAQLARRATHDPLTDLPNRLMLEEQLGSYLSLGRSCGVLSCDLDRFKTINDSLGHEAGDELLAATARRLREVVPASGMVGRVGGDEFVVLLPDHDRPELARTAALQVMEQLAEPIVVRGHRHTLAVSIGVTVSGPWHEHPDEVLRQADQALVRAKRGGRGRAEVYDPTQDKLATVEDLQLEHALRTAINDRVGILPYFQPIISIADNKTVGYEALARWVHPEKGLLSPAVFLPLAEQTGLIRSLGWLMLDQSCRAATNPDELGGRSRWIAVNASGSQLGCHQLVPAIERALEQSGLAPQRLHLEITEAELVDLGPAAVAEIHAVAEMGVGIALDDFGTGYSSLSLLRDLPVSTVKIDRSFVAPIAVDRSATAIVRSVIGLCQELGVTTVAEGVETDEQLTTLRALGCSQAQGFLFGRPAPVTTRRARTSLVRRIRL